MTQNETAILAAMRGGQKTADQIAADSHLSVTTVRRVLAYLGIACRLRIVRRHVGKTKAAFYTLID